MPAFLRMGDSLGDQLIDGHAERGGAGLLLGVPAYSLRALVLELVVLLGIWLGVLGGGDGVLRRLVVGEGLKVAGGGGGV